ncbi:MAG: type II secretion system GspH family protein [Patescibacteria group bacterium]|nr:type II secretion system GspH family protein [Patescibacteria group bacterium]
MNKKNKKSGFTLIELLVVIAIIGILSSIVLASLSTARNKGRDAAVQGELSSLRSQAEIYASNNSNSFANLFTTNNTWASADANVQAILTGINTNTTTHTAGSGALVWAAQAQLPTTLGGTAAYWCVDSTGVSKKVTTAMVAGATVCPAN